MDKKQEEEFLAEENNFKAKRAGCLLIMGLLAVEAVAAGVGISYYFTRQNNASIAKSTQITKHVDLKHNEIVQNTR